VVLVPETAGVLSALGLVAGDERRDHVRSHLRPLEEVRDLPAEGEADLRYRGQSFELTVPLQPGLATAFHRAHAERYGYADEAREIELVAVRTADVVPGPEVRLQATERRKFTGPALVELPGATCWVPDGWHGATNDDGTLMLAR
jgi:N-methylhydantoinase A